MAPACTSRQNSIKSCHFHADAMENSMTNPKTSGKKFSAAGEAIRLPEKK
ncbi:hypothetical protein BN128_2208 [Cronobacter sakazakii 696]|nr:hypothetical protein BN128_2208 [Cronobacter sakazakii 696]